jgi:hypothetical protein
VNPDRMADLKAQYAQALAEAKQTTSHEVDRSHASGVAHGLWTAAFLLGVDLDPERGEL